MVPAPGPGMKRRNAAMATRTVKWFNGEKGYGFIAPDDGSEDVSAISSGSHRSLAENQRARFEVVQGPKGPQAERVQLL